MTSGEKIKRRVELMLTYPPDWEDEDRMHFLLGPFSPNAVWSLSLNDQKVQFWSSLVRSACRASREPVFSERQMAQRLQWRGQAPRCLHHVLNLMQQAGQLRLVEGEEERRASGWLTWGYSLLSSPIRWVWYSYLSTTNQGVADKTYVDAYLIKEVADTVLKQLQSRVEFKNTDQLVTGVQFRAVCMELVGASSVREIGNELIRHGKMKCQAGSDGTEVIKFSMAGESGPINVTDMDQGILRLKESIATLHRHVSSLTKRVQFLKIKAREHLHLKERQLALQCVRRGHDVQQLVASKTEMLNNLQHILQQIQMAETNGLVLDAYRKGTETLKAMQRESALTLAEAERTVDELHEAMHIVDEVGDVLGEDVLGESVENEELERELQALLSSTQTSKEPVPTEEDGVTRQLAQLQLNSRATDQADTSCQMEQGSVTSGKDNGSKNKRHKPLLT